MAVYRVWAECISDVYVDVEANSEEEAFEFANELDGGAFVDDGYGDWRMGSLCSVHKVDAEPMFNANEDN